MSSASAYLALDTGTRIIGRCFLPFHTKERLDGGYDLLFQVRSNFGGLRKSAGIGICLTYRKRDRQWVLKIREPEQAIESQLPMFITASGAQDSEGLSVFKVLHLVKPNKHFLKYHDRSVFCKGGVLTVPVLLSHDEGVVLEGALEIYPSVIKGREYLVIKVTGLPVVMGRS